MELTNFEIVINTVNSSERVLQNEVMNIHTQTMLQHLSGC
jgi:hypothetical protein